MSLLTENEREALEQAETCGCCSTMDEVFALVPEYGLQHWHRVDGKQVRNNLADLVEKILARVAADVLDEGASFDREHYDPDSDNPYRELAS